MVKITMLGIVTELGLQSRGSVSLLEGKIRAENKNVIEFYFQCWGKQAEALNSAIKIDDQILIDGRISVDNKGYIIEVNDLVKCSYN